MKILLLIFILGLMISQICSKVFPHIIWMYWDRGYQYMGGLEKLCVSRIISLHQKTDWQVRLVQQNTLKIWLNQKNYQNLLNIMAPNSGVQVQGQSDFIRYYLLKQHGGIWLDVSVLLYQNLNWFDDILNNPLVIHKNVFKDPQVFFFDTYWGYSAGQRKIIKYKGENIYPILNMESAIIAAKPQSSYINDQIKQMLFLVKYGQIGFENIKRYYNFQYTYSDYFRVFLANSISLYKKHEQFETAMHQNNNLEENVKKLYKILTINKDKVMYHIQQDEKYYKYYFQPEGRPFGNYGRYLRKFHHFGPKQAVQSVLNGERNQIQRILQQWDTDNYIFWNRYFRQDYKCLEFFLIRQQSIINKYLLSNYQLAKFLYPKMKVYKDQELPYICRWTDLQKIRAVMPVLLEWPIYGVMLFVTVEIIVELIFHVFSKSSLYLSGQNKFQKKRHVWRKLLLFVTIYAEKDLILNQYKLLLIQSLNALMVIIFMVAFSIFLINFAVNYHSSHLNIIQSRYFQLYFCIMIVIQYLVEYNFAVWKYQGQVYNYFKIQEQNMITMQYSQNFVIKILIIVICYYVLVILKKVFELQLIEDFISKVDKKHQYTLVQQLNQQKYFQQRSKKGTGSYLYQEQAQNSKFLKKDANKIFNFEVGQEQNAQYSKEIKFNQRNNCQNDTK